MKKIYICFRIEEVRECVKAWEYCRFIATSMGAIPIAPGLFTSEKDDREVRLSILFECDELWYFGDQITRGMVAEIIAAKESGIPVRYYSQKDIEKMKGEFDYEN